MPSVRIGVRDVAPLARGCAFLSCGGGGDMALSELLAREQLSGGGSVRVVDLDELPDDALVMPCGLVGSPLVFEERLLVGDEPFELLRAVEREHGRAVDALMPFELPGANGLVALAWAAALGLPLADADGMGRPISGLRTTMWLAGVAATPACMVDGDGASLTIRAATRARFAATAIGVAGSLGGVGAIAFDLMDAATARTATIRGAVTRALAIGRAGGAQRRAAEAIAASAGGRVLASGRVVHVEQRSLVEGAHGSLLVEAERDVLRIEFREEHLLVLAAGRPLAATPDTIAVLDAESGWPVLVDDARGGQRVTVVAAPCDPAWRTPAGLAACGPDAHGFAMPSPEAP